MQHVEQSVSWLSKARLAVIQRPKVKIAGRPGQTEVFCRHNRHTCITKLAEGQASEQTLMSIAGHLSRKMIEHYSHIRMDAKRRATDAIVEGSVNQNVNQLSASNSNVAAKSLN